jgi:hypothetical protein
MNAIVSVLRACDERMYARGHATNVVISTTLGDSMKSRHIVTLVATSALALGPFVVWPTAAAPPAPPVAGMVGFAPSSVAGCPNINWRLARHDDGKITGIFWYSDLSGTSEAVGSEDSTGRFHIGVKSAVGQGPVGVVDGTRSPQGKVVATMKGEGCANDRVVRMIRVKNINSYPEATTG